MSTPMYYLASKSEARKAAELAMQHGEETNTGSIRASVCLIQQTWFVSVGDALTKVDRFTGLCFEDGMLKGYKKTRCHVTT